MLEFAKYLKEHFNENIETAEQLIEKKWNKTNYIIKEAFEGRYSNRSTAINKIKNDFTNPNIAPKSIDVDFLKKNLNYVLEKVESLSETDIKIIINTDINKSGKVSSVSTSTSDCDGGCKASFDDVGTIELESVKSKRGRKKKIVAEDMDDDYSNEYNVDNINTDIDSPFKGQLDFSEEPEDAGEEPEDSIYDEVEDAGEEPEDSISWEDVMDDEAFDAPNKDLFDSVTAKQIMGTLIRVNENWYNVISMNEDKKITCSDLRGKKYDFQIHEIDEMECLQNGSYDKASAQIVKPSNGIHSAEEEVEEPEDAGEEPEDSEEPEDAGEEPEDSEAEEEFEEPEDAGEEPEDSEEPEDAGEEPEDSEEPEDAGEEPEDAGEEPEDSEAEEEMLLPSNDHINEHYKVANRYMEDDIYKSDDNILEGSGLTSVPRSPKKKIENVSKPERGISKKPPTADLTGKPSKPKINLTNVKSAPKMPKKVGPKADLTGKPSKPKINKVNVKYPTN